MSTHTVLQPHSNSPSFLPAPAPRPRRGRYGTLSRLRAAGQQGVSLRLHGLLEALPAEVCDEQERCDRAQVHELDFALLSMGAETLRGIELALERSRSGKDAECFECGQAIKSARLRALPFAVRCRPCQGSLEARARLAAPASRPTPGEIPY